MSLIEYQRTILADHVRNQAFADALKKRIIPGVTTVADIGAGTGYLSFLARTCGAKECHLYEVSELSALSQSLAKENGITGCHFVHKHSTEVKSPPKVDLVISETFGNFALEESIISNMNDARRFLKPDGTIMPMNLRQYVCPVVTDRIQKTIDTWSGIAGDMQWSAARETGLNNMYVKEIQPEDLFNDGTQEWDYIDFSKRNNEIRKATVLWRLQASKLPAISGFALWWESDLAPGVTLSTSPFAEKTHWQQIYLPLIKPLHLKDDQTLELSLHIDSRYDVRINVAWKTTVKSSDNKTLRSMNQDMRRGFLN
jgi:protein arginine N-methyltransferase 1